MAGPILSRTRRRARWAGAFLAALIVLPALALPHLHINNSPEVYVPPHAPAAVVERELRERFPEDDLLIALLEGDELYSADFLRAVDRVATKLEGHRWIERVLTVTTLDRIAGTADGFVVERLLGGGAIDALTPAERRARAVNDSFAPGRVVSPDGDALAIAVRPVPLEGSLQRWAVYEAAREALRDAGLSGSVSGLAGHVALDVAELRAMIRDALVFVPATIAIGLVLVGWMFRRPLAVGLTALTLAAVVGSTVGLIAVWGRPYNLITSIVPPLMAALTVAFLVHLFTGLRHASARGAEGPERVTRALAEVRRPALYTALTTAIGLASLALSPIRPIQTLGLASAAGMGVLYVTSMVLLPALLMRWDARPWPPGVRSTRVAERVVGALGRFAMRKAGWVVLASVLAVGLAAPRIADVTAETDLYEFFEKSHPLIEATRRVEAALSGVTTLEVAFEGRRRDALKDPERLAAIRDFQQWADGRPQVDRSLSVIDFIEEMNWAFHGEDPSYRRLPEDRRLISQYLFVYDGRDLYDVVDREFRWARVTLNLNVHGANEIQRVIEGIEARLEGGIPEELDWRIAGMGRLLADQEDLLIQGQVRSLWTVLGLIFGLMWLMWRSLPAALLCMVPNVSPIVLIFSLMGLFGIWLDFATAIIASVAVGIAVDDTVHVYHGYARRRGRGRSVPFAVLRSLRQAGLAVTVSTVILVAQFLLVATSPFIPTAQFGLLTAAGLTTAWLFDVLLLPALLALGTRLQRRRSLRRHA